jgi:hypothetical protein
VEAPVSTFVVRIWPEWSAQGPAWRGHVVHLQSGCKRGFRETATMLAFMNQMAAIETDTGSASSNLQPDGHGE